jgi:hypothetical protein
MFSTEISTYVRLGSKAPLWTCASHFRSSSTSGLFPRRRHVSTCPNSRQGTYPELEATVAEESATDVA